MHYVSAAYLHKESHALDAWFSLCKNTRYSKEYLVFILAEDEGFVCIFFCEPTVQYKTFYQTLL